MISLPIALFGIPLKGVNNPILVTFASANVEIITEPSELPDQFFTYFKEATGFECNVNLNLRGKIPYATKYVYLSQLYFQEAIKKCSLPISNEEMNDILSMIDDAIYNSELIRGLRRALILGKDILYRDEEDPVPINLKKFKIELLYSYPLPDNYNYIDNSLIHLLGILPVEFAETQDVNLIRVENGLWFSLYSIPSPVRLDWKIIWDLNYASVIELRGEEHFNN
ncbi:hypothetical protein [Sulfurisphaera ohwakuensis]|uniref:Uncharacterized protein n=1 Tax=Sulfurisphaera ohwakuensis TaxID=69656 RepID=A0A650CJJ5_SULOH|nr:hypothetical protein [Sulfurisphaera ohwakuensis]MBB5253376.1 hypothetical protein [Sulfurisphaera ohwakuensis]QGR17697.1 hypothetical protein D1869_11305 [Sulfurisphaera ohwakuensis]